MSKPRIYFSRCPNGSGLDWFVEQGTRVACGTSPSAALTRFIERYGNNVVRKAVEGEQLSEVAA